MNVRGLAEDAPGGRGLVTTLLSFEAPFVLFIFAGIYKADPRLAFVPIDLTVFFAGLSGLCGIWILVHRDTPIPSHAVQLIATFGAFAGYAALSLLWTPSTLYGPQKVLALSTFVAWALAGSALIIAGEPARVGRFARMILWLSLAVAIEALWSLTHLHMAAPGPGGVVEHYLASGRLFAAGAIVCAVSATERSATPSRKLFEVGALGLFLALMLTIGGRGPFLALVVSLATALAVGFRRSPEQLLSVRWPTVLLAGVMGVFLVTILTLIVSGNQTFATVRRLALLLSEGGGTSAGIRMYYYVSAWHAWLDAPLFGHGIGSWPMMAYHVDERNYPHNIVLEALAELGMIGVGLLATLTAIALSKLRQLRRQTASMSGTLAWVLLLSTFLNALVSGDFADNRFFFGALGLVAGLRVAGRAPSDLAQPITSGDATTMEAM